MKLEVVMLRANCVNCRHYDKDERTAHRHRMRRLPGMPQVFCPIEGIKDNICGKFLPRKADVINAIWRAKDKSNTNDVRPAPAGTHEHLVGNSGGVQ